jgi:hypothetical protein
MVPIKSEFGEEKAWSIIRTLDPADLCKRADISYDSDSGVYTLSSFGMEFYIAPSERDISTDSPRRDFFLSELKDLFRLSVLWYLIGAKEIPFTGRLVKPSDIKGGQRFSGGTYLLPLNEIEEKYGRDREAFLKRGKEFGAELIDYGDVAIRLFPLPRIPVSILLWLEDEEFPARADLLFDSSCEFHIDVSDILWAIAVVSIKVML